MVYKYFDKKTWSGISINKNIVKELHKPVNSIKKFKRNKVYSKFKDNVWASDLDEMEWMFSKNKKFKYLLRVIDVFTKHAWV